jgi:hypothetical protein
MLVVVRLLHRQERLRRVLGRERDRLQQSERERGLGVDVNVLSPRCQDPDSGRGSPGDGAHPGSEAPVRRRADGCADSGHGGDGGDVIPHGSRAFVLNPLRQHGQLLAVHERDLNKLQPQAGCALGPPRSFCVGDAPGNHLTPARHDESVHHQRLRKRRREGVAGIAPVARKRLIDPRRDPRPGRQRKLRSRPIGRTVCLRERRFRPGEKKQNRQSAKPCKMEAFHGDILSPKGIWYTLLLI